jgi:hypothetical protein
VACSIVWIYLKRAAATDAISFVYRFLEGIAGPCCPRLRKGFTFVYQSLANVMASCWQRLERRVRRRPAQSAELTSMGIRDDDLL